MKQMISDFAGEEGSGFWLVIQEGEGREVGYGKKGTGW